MLGQYRIREIHKLFIFNDFRILSDKVKQRDGALGGNRTHDPRLRKPVLYPTELRTRDAHHNKKMSKVKYINADKHH
jgi:hypothetical protein